MRATRATARVIAWAFVVGLGMFYGLFAWVFGGGAWGIVALLYLLIPNVLAFAHMTPHKGTRTLAVSRWGVKFLIFVLIAAMTSSGDIAGPESLLLGALYFAVLTVVELYRVVEIPPDLATVWGKSQSVASE